MIVIHHNALCGTSRNVLARIRAAGVEPVVIDYLKEGWTRAYLLTLFAAAGIAPREALRANVAEAEGLADADDAALVDAMVRHPILVNRPFVATPRGVRLCRPADTVDSLLEPA